MDEYILHELRQKTNNNIDNKLHIAYKLLHSKVSTTVTIIGLLDMYANSHQMALNNFTSYSATLLVPLGDVTSTKKIIINEPFLTLE